MGIFVPLDKNWKCENETVGHIAGIWNGLGHGTVSSIYGHIVRSGLKVFMHPGLEWQVPQLLAAYADVFSTGETDVEKTTLLEQEIQVDQGTVPIRQPPGDLDQKKAEKWKCKYIIRFNRV